MKFELGRFLETCLSRKSSTNCIIKVFGSVVLFYGFNQVFHYYKWENFLRKH